MKIKLGPEQCDIGNNRGPAVGMFALQQALRKDMPDWFSIGDEMTLDGTIPWLWNYEYWPLAVHCHHIGHPFIVGPNMLFADSHKTRQYAYERTICDSPHCRLIVTESNWYADLIARNLGHDSKAKIAVVPYPVTLPHKHRSFTPVTFDALIYVKSGVTDRMVTELELSFPRHITFRYGHYDRDQLIYAARCSKCCMYLSDDDRGPLAAAEILLTGCPVVGVERGCPWIKAIPVVGFLIEELDCVPLIVQAARSHLRCDRQEVRQISKAFFDPEKAAKAIFAALDEVRQP